MSSNSIVKRLLGESEPSERELALLNTLLAADIDVEYIGPWKFSVNGKVQSVEKFKGYDIKPSWPAVHFDNFDGDSVSDRSGVGRAHIAIFDDNTIDLAYFVEALCRGCCEDYFYFPFLGTVGSFTYDGHVLAGSVDLELSDGMACPYRCENLGNITTLVPVSLPKKDKEMLERNANAHRLSDDEIEELENS